MLSRSPHFFRFRPPLLSLFLRYSSTQGHNDAIIKMLIENREKERKNPASDDQKLRAFDKAIAVLKSIDFPIRSESDALKLMRMRDDNAQGEEPMDVKISTKASHAVLILLVILTCLQEEDKLQPAQVDSARINEVREGTKRVVLNELQQVPGLGPYTARKLYEAGCTSASDLHRPKFQGILTARQKVLVAYYNHLRQPVHRTEIESINDFIRTQLPSDFQTELAGSYRRDFPFSSEIDLILLHPSFNIAPVPPPPETTLKFPRKGRAEKVYGKCAQKQFGSKSPLLNTVIPTLKVQGLIVQEVKMSGGDNWDGIVRVPEFTADGQPESLESRLSAIKWKEGKYRRLTINLVPWECRGPALLTLTGDMEFVRQVHTRADTLGLFLDGNGLWRWHENENFDGVAPVKRGRGRPPKDAKINEETRGKWELISRGSETEILSELGMAYVEPSKRNYSYLLSKVTNGRLPKLYGSVVRKKQMEDRRSSGSSL
ncbi:Nucleotidyltransferase [Guyanagaster necrorhizus]|uniref:Nucleotidyltransferase n=1 Tax=Guyanagaster necrorhizus TaxID=856835 RepID=A0A9P8AS30_9AGAR|nr:Nucleotidyltransferase [Guyanagaster necrorhizus MCA 3950]KAG7445700.1 Nucleotidyltransferase [Guyanagaster necrorhizus MCA 3950]